MQDRAAEARALLARGMAAFEELGVTMTSSVTHPASFVAMLAGDAATAEAHLRRDYRRLERMGEHNYLATTAAFLAQAIAAQGRPDEAEPYVAVSRDTGAGEDFLAQVVWQGLLARILATRGQLAEAEDLARAAIALAARTDFLNQHGDALLELAAVLAQAGRTPEAQGKISEALGLYQRKGNLMAAARARRRLERFLPRDKIRRAIPPAQRGDDGGVAVQQPGEAAGQRPDRGRRPAAARAVPDGIGHPDGRVPLPARPGRRGRQGSGENWGSGMWGGKPMRGRIRSGKARCWPSAWPSSPSWRNTRASPPSAGPSRSSWRARGPLRPHHLQPVRAHRADGRVAPEPAQRRVAAGSLRQRCQRSA
jgi:tetratricopeptide (TPR) repeat protein